MLEPGSAEPLYYEYVIMSFAKSGHGSAEPGSVRSISYSDERDMERESKALAVCMATNEKKKW